MSAPGFYVLPGPKADDQIDQPARRTDGIIEDIRRQIVEGDLADGDRLPAMEVLAERYNVSAPSMRQVLRALEAEGLITVMRGAIGGAVVRRPTHETAATTLALVMAAQGTELRELREALSVIEPACAALCARRGQRSLVRDLRRLNQEARRLVDDGQGFVENMTAFHGELIHRCGSKPLTMVARALGVVYVGNLSEETLKKGFAKLTSGPTERLAEIEAHEELTTLIEERREHDVYRLMIEHDHQHLSVALPPRRQLVTTRVARLNEAALSR